VEVFILEGWAVTGPGGRGINTEVREPGAHLMGCRLRGLSQSAVDDSVVGEIVTTEVVRVGKHKGWHAVQTETGRYYLLGESMVTRVMREGAVGNVGSVR
jgi:hypothetical protein